ncbi:MAG: peptidoglycan-associated lipoprotein Pal [Halochromatium sp.]|uniref:peptidoglycan-associated lipoprotein Pal n=1 Tax=Halochromatium sp. TaxID=2049430 RepID=UPI00397D3256
MIDRPLSLLLVAASLALGACTTTPPPPATPSAAELDASRDDAGARAGAAEASARSPLDDPASPLYRRLIHFEYNASAIQPEYADLLRAHAEYIFNTPDVTVRLEGHTDERGTRGYNLALGERRSQAVRSFLMAEGVPGERLTTLSYGEERPANPARSESAWRENRRVELVYE